MTQPEKTPRRGLTPRDISVAVLTAVAVAFVVENTRRTTIRFLVPTVHAPLWLALLATLAVGFVVGLLVGRRRSRG